MRHQSRLQVVKTPKPDATTLAIKAFCLPSRDDMTRTYFAEVAAVRRAGRLAKELFMLLASDGSQMTLPCPQCGVNLVLPFTRRKPGSQGPA